jgi:hypothetical protein
LIPPDQFAVRLPVSCPCQMDEFGISFRVHLLLTE